MHGITEGTTEQSRFEFLIYETVHHTQAFYYKCYKLCAFAKKRSYFYCFYSIKSALSPNGCSNLAFYKTALGQHVVRQDVGFLGKCTPGLF